MSESVPDPTERFSNRVDDYVRYRPGYPPALFDSLEHNFGMTAGQTAADVGSGTGIFAALLLGRGLTVFGIEPNGAMRTAAERRLRRERSFKSVAAEAEATTLADSGVDWIFAAQAFHWFDVARFRVEAARILRPNGRVVLVWNNRRRDTPFLTDYERLLQGHGTDYGTVRHEGAETDGRIAALFAPRSFVARGFDNEQRLDEDALKGRTFSSSYTPHAGDPRHSLLDAALGELFDRHQRGGEVVMEYETRMYIGRIA